MSSTTNSICGCDPQTNHSATLSYHPGRCASKDGALQKKVTKKKKEDADKFAIVNAREMLFNYFKVKRGLLSSITFLTFYILLFMFLSLTHSPERISPQTRSISKVQPVALLAVSPVYTATSLWSTVITTGLLGIGQVETCCGSLANANSVEKAQTALLSKEWASRMNSSTLGFTTTVPSSAPTAEPNGLRRSGLSRGSSSRTLLTSTPITSVPTTGVPTAAAYTSNVPTTGTPTRTPTLTPTTKGPTNNGDTYGPTTTGAPTTNVPTTFAPNTNVPTTGVPTNVGDTYGPTVEPSVAPTVSIRTVSQAVLFTSLDISLYSGALKANYEMGYGVAVGACSGSTTPPCSSYNTGVTSISSFSYNRRGGGATITFVITGPTADMSTYSDGCSGTCTTTTLASAISIASATTVTISKLTNAVLTTTGTAEPTLLPTAAPTAPPPVGDLLTRGFDWDSPAGYVVGGILVTVTTKPEKVCKYENVEIDEPCYYYESNGDTSPLVLNNGMKIPYNEDEGGHSIFFASNLPRYNLTSMASLLKIGGYMNASRFSLTYESHVFYVDTSALIKVAAKFEDNGAGQYITKSVYPSKGIKLVLPIQLNKPWSENGNDIALFVIMFMLWFVDFSMYLFEIYKHLYGICEWDPFTRGPIAWLGLFFHQPHTGEPKFTDDEFNSNKHDKDGEGKFEDEDFETCMDTWMVHYNPKKCEDESCMRYCLGVGSNKSSLKVSSGDIEPMLPGIFHGFFILYLVCLWVLNDKLKDLSGLFDNKQWLLDLKLAGNRMGPVVIQEDIDLQLLYYRRLIQPNMNTDLIAQYIEWQWVCVLFLLVVGAFRLLQHLAFQRLLATLTDAILKVKSQLMHTMIILFVIVTAFACIGYLILSRHVSQFGSYGSALSYMMYLTFAILKLPYIQCQNVGAVGTTFALAIKVLVVGVVLKMVTALIITGYKNQQKEDAPDTRGLWEDIKLACYMGRNDNLAKLFGDCCSTCCQKGENALGESLVYKPPPLHLREMNQIFAHHDHFLDFCRDATSFLTKKENEDWWFKLGIPEEKSTEFMQKWTNKKREFRVTDKQTGKFIATAMKKYCKEEDKQDTEAFKNWIWKYYSIAKCTEKLGPPPKAAKAK